MESTDMTTPAIVEVENLKATLRTAQLEAAEQRSAAEQPAAELAMVKTASQKHEARVAEVQQELADAVTKCEALELKNKEQAAKLTSLGAVAKEVWTEARGYQEELHQVRLIANAKPYLLQSIFGGNRFALLTRVWHSPGTFADLPKSAADAARFFTAQEGRAEQRLFWVKFQAPEHPSLLNNQMKQLMELHRMVEPVMKDLCIKLWPSEPLPSSYFGLVQRLYDATPRIDAWKRSACFEGARMAFGKTKVHWPKIKPVEMATGPPPPGKEHRRPEQYFPIVMDGARVIEAQCSKDVIYE
jgi:hypothetical protein